MNCAVLSFVFLLFCFGFFGSSRPAFAVPDVYYFCDTTSDYKKLLRYYEKFPSPSDQMISYMKKRLPKGKNALELSKKEFQALGKGFKVKKPNPPKVACHKIPGRSLVVVKKRTFSTMTCVRPPSWDTCKWIDERVIGAKWKLSADRKKYVRR